MPYKIRKLPHSNRVRVYKGKEIIARKTTRDKAEKQVRLLRGLEHGMILRKRKK